MEENKQLSQEEQINEAIANLDAKNFGIYFFTLDTKGNPTAGVANIYEHVKVLTKLGYQAHILHEKNDYRIHANEHGAGIVDWLGEEYGELSHVSIENQKLNISAKDILVIPEVFANLMEQCKAFPCKKVVLSQSYDYILEILPLGASWSNYGFNDVITTSQKQADYIKGLFPTINTHIIPISIPSYFKPTDEIKKPIISIFTREQKEAVKLVKSFYLQYPTYKWVTFRELRGLSRKEFANSLGESCLSVWVDPISSLGTFPLESIECETPTIGLMPNMVPEWMESEPQKDGTILLKNNGVWTNNIMGIPDLIAQFLKVWLEDTVPVDLTNTILASKGKFSEEAQEAKINQVFTTLVSNRKLELAALIPAAELQVEK